MSEQDPGFQDDDEIQRGCADVGYRVTVDLSDDDADLLDEVARAEGIQPTQILLQALRVYARREAVHTVQVRAIDRLGAALRRVA